MGKAKAEPIHKKGDNTNIEYNRPKSLLSHLYKLLTRMIANHFTIKLNLYQPVEEAAFRKVFYCRTKNNEI